MFNNLFIHTHTYKTRPRPTTTQKGIIHPFCSIEHTQTQQNVVLSYNNNNNPIETTINLMRGEFCTTYQTKLFTLPLQWWLCRHDDLWPQWQYLWPLVIGDLEFKQTTKYNHLFAISLVILIFSHSNMFGMFTSLITKLSLNYVVVPTKVSSFCITYFLSFSPWIWGVGRVGGGEGGRARGGVRGRKIGSGSWGILWWLGTPNLK